MNYINIYIYIYTSYIYIKIYIYTHTIYIYTIYIYTVYIYVYTVYDSWLLRGPQPHHVMSARRTWGHFFGIAVGLDLGIKVVISIKILANVYLSL